MERLRRKGLIVILTLGALAPRALCADAVRFHRTAVVSADFVRLSDIAQVTAADAERQRRLQDLTIVPSPPPGQERRIELSEIRSRMQAQGVNLASTELSGSSLIVVRRDAPSASSPMVTTLADVRAQRAAGLVAEAVQSYLSRIAPEMGHCQIEVDLPDAHAAAVGEAGARGYEIRGGKPPWELPQQLLVRYLDSQERLQEVAVTCRIVRRPLIVTAARPISAGQILQAGDLRLVAGDVGSQGFTTVEKVIGMEARGSIRTGETILPRDVRDVPLIRTNDIVTVYSRAPGVVVRRQYKSVSQGARGETVTLVGLDDRREKLLARVIGYHEAETLDSVPATAATTREMGSLR